MTMLENEAGRQGLETTYRLPLASEWSSLDDIGTDQTLLFASLHVFEPVPMSRISAIEMGGHRARTEVEPRNAPLVPPSAASLGLRVGTDRLIGMIVTTSVEGHLLHALATDIVIETVGIPQPWMHRAHQHDGIPPDHTTRVALCAKTRDPHIEDVAHLRQLVPTLRQGHGDEIAIMIHHIALLGIEGTTETGITIAIVIMSGSVNGPPAGGSAMTKGMTLILRLVVGIATDMQILRQMTNRHESMLGSGDVRPTIVEREHHRGILVQRTERIVVMSYPAKQPSMAFNHPRVLGDRMPSPSSAACVVAGGKQSDLDHALIGLPRGRLPVTGLLRLATVTKMANPTKVRKPSVEPNHPSSNHHRLHPNHRVLNQAKRTKVSIRWARERTVKFSKLALNAPGL